MVEWRKTELSVYCDGRLQHPKSQLNSLTFLFLITLTNLGFVYNLPMTQMDYNL